MKRILKNFKDNRFVKAVTNGVKETLEFTKSAIDEYNEAKAEERLARKQAEARAARFALVRKYYEDYAVVLYQFVRDVGSHLGIINRANPREYMLHNIYNQIDAPCKLIYHITANCELDTDKIERELRIFANAEYGKHINVLVRRSNGSYTVEIRNPDLIRRFNVDFCRADNQLYFIPTDGSPSYAVRGAYKFRVLKYGKWETQTFRIINYGYGWLFALGTMTCPLTSFSRDFTRIISDVHIELLD